MNRSLRAHTATRAVALFKEGQDLRAAMTPVGRTALKNLAQAAAAAEVPEEMEIALRYQAAREVIPLKVSALLLAELERFQREDASTAREAFSELLGHLVRLHRSLPEVSR